MGKKFDINKHCIVHEKQNAKGDVYVLHGANSSALLNLPLINKIKKETEYNVIACDMRGYGTRKLMKRDIKESINDYISVIDSRPQFQNNYSFIGKSLGGIVAVNLSAKKNPSKLFLISSPHGIDVLKNWNIFRKLWYRSLFKEIEDILPQNISKLNIDSNNIYVFHNKQDDVIPFSEFESNVKKFKIPEKNTLVESYHIPIFGHLRSVDSTTFFDFIIKNLKN